MTALEERNGKDVVRSNEFHCLKYFRQPSLDGGDPLVQPSEFLEHFLHPWDTA